MHLKRVLENAEHPSMRVTRQDNGEIAITIDMRLNQQQITTAAALLLTPGEINQLLATMER